MKVREAEKRKAELLRIEEKLGSEAAEAMADYLTLFDEGFYIWLANLYDPETGALYYSNSARDNKTVVLDGWECELLPDLESTPRGYGWLAGVGMLENYNDSLKEAFPEWLTEKLIKWTQGLQSPEDGYFYHPQWQGRETVSRLGRDLDYATTFLKRLGGDILYDTPNGCKGIYGAPRRATAAKDGGAVTAMPEHLKDIGKFREYLDSFNWEKNSYSSGNTFESQWAQIRSAGDEFINAYKAYLDGRQEKMQERLRSEAEAALLERKPDATADEIKAARDAAENGIWEPKLRYNAVNGLMKIGSTYTRLGLKLNYIEKAFESALRMVMLEEPDADGKTAGASVDVYNPWCCLNQLISNAEKFHSPELAARLRKRITDNAAELIRITRRKASVFRKPDGSYGYMSYGVPCRSQMMPVAIPDTNEGDVNGGTIATRTIIGHMCEALGVKCPSLYFGSDYEKFISIIEKKNAEYLAKQEG